MRSFYLFFAMLLVCGCMQPAEGPTTSTAPSMSSATTTLEDYAYVLPTTRSTTTSAAPVGEPTTTTPTPTTLSPDIRTFKDNGGRICAVGGKPVIRMYSKSDCDHCLWSGPVFDKVVKEYAERGDIVAHHWVFDAKDDVLTDALEGAIPDGEEKVFLDGKQTTVPYFSFGCRFTRTGNGYYIRNRPDMEEDEFRAVIEQILNTNN